MKTAENWVHLTPVSSNVKTGPIPVSTSSPSTCPDSCPLKKAGCYADSVFHLRLHWEKVERKERGGSWKTFCESIANLPQDQLWRHNQAGDLPGKNDSLDRKALSELVQANKGKRGFTYTHKKKGAYFVTYRKAIKEGFTINLSCDSLEEVDKLKGKSLPLVVVLPSNTEGKAIETPKGERVVVCPAQRVEGITCDKCRLCSKADRPFTIGFLAHGNQKGKINDRLA